MVCISQQVLAHRKSAPLKRGASTIAMLSKSPILPAYVGPTKIHGLLTGQAYINIGKPIDINDLPKDLKRKNQHMITLQKEIETRTAKLQQELHEIVKSL